MSAYLNAGMIDPYVMARADPNSHPNPKTSPKPELEP